MKDAISPSELVAQYGGSYARELGIDLSTGDAMEVQKWFLAAILFGARISGKIAARTYGEFERAGIVQPEAILSAGWHELVTVLGRGGYARYDFKTADKLLSVSTTLSRDYAGDLNMLHRVAVGETDLERRIKQLGKGIGDVTVSIFLREMRGAWPKAQPLPSEQTVQSAQSLGLLSPEFSDRTRMLQALEAAWLKDGMKPDDFPHFEAALVRFGASLRRKAMRGIS